MARQAHDAGVRKRRAREAQEAQQGSQNVLDLCKRLVARGLATEAVLGGAKMGRRWNRENGYTEFTVDDEGQR